MLSGAEVCPLAASLAKQLEACRVCIHHARLHDAGQVHMCAQRKFSSYRPAVGRRCHVTLGLIAQRRVETLAVLAYAFHICNTMQLHIWQVAAVSQSGALAGTTGALIFTPWIEKIESLGGRFRTGHYVRDVLVDSSGAITSVLADTKEAGSKVSPRWLDCGRSTQQSRIYQLRLYIQGCCKLHGPAMLM